MNFSALHRTSDCPPPLMLILLAGLLGYHLLPVSALPQVDYPTIQVYTQYPGASPDVVSSSITAPLERQFGQMPGLKKMSSASSNGASAVTLQFDLVLSLDVAEQEVQAAINASASFLPANLPYPPVYSKVNPGDAPVLTLSLTSRVLPLTKSRPCGTGSPRRSRRVTVGLCDRAGNAAVRIGPIPARSTR